MHAFLITGGSQEDRTKKIETLCREWAVLPIDIYTIDIKEEKRTIGIDEIRMLSEHLLFSPRQSPYSIAVIHHASALTPDAQNALLKTLEEPPAYVRIILESDHESLLLPTILSRCQTLHLNSHTAVSEEDKKNALQMLEDIQGKKPGELCRFTDQYINKKEDGREMINTLLSVIHEELLSLSQKDQSKEIAEKQKRMIRTIRAIQTSQNQLQANVNKALIFDALFFTISLDKKF